MGKIVAVVGNTGAGKTSLVRAFATQSNFRCGLEQHSDRPFQRLFISDPRYGLANQVDYMLLRATQERDFRMETGIALVDGGLDQDFHGFTRLFHTRGYLSDAEFGLCQELYSFLRSLLPLPDLFIHLTIDENTLIHRLASRDRINIAQPDDLLLLDTYLTEWLSALESDRVLTLDVSHEDMVYSGVIPVIMEKILKFDPENNL